MSGSTHVVTLSKALFGFPLILSHDSLYYLRIHIFVLYGSYFFTACNPDKKASPITLYHASRKHMARVFDALRNELYWKSRGRCEWWSVGPFSDTCFLGMPLLETTYCNRISAVCGAVDSPSSGTRWHAVENPLPVVGHGNAKINVRPKLLWDKGGFPQTNKQTNIHHMAACKDFIFKQKPLMFALQHRQDVNSWSAEDVRQMLWYCSVLDERT